MIVIQESKSSYSPVIKKIETKILKRDFFTNTLTYKNTPTFKTQINKGVVTYDY